MVINSFYNGTFLGAPLSSKTKTKKGFLFHKFKDNKGALQVALLGQMRVFDTKRIKTYIGKINDEDVGGKIKCRKRKIKCRIFATNYLSFNLKLKL